MFRRLINKAKESLITKKQKENKKQKKEPISKDIEKNYERVKKLFAKSEDVTIRRFTMGKGKVKVFALFVDGMINKKLVDDDILKPLILKTRSIDPSKEKIKNIYNWVKEKVLTADQVKETNDFKEGVGAALSGDTAIFIDGYNRALLASTRGWEERGVQKPMVEKSVRGPKEAFTETLRINTSLLRRKVKDTNLKFESMVIGEISRTLVSISYIEGIANPKIVKEVKKRLKSIEIDGILDASYILELIEDNPLSPLPTMHRTERPDGVASKLLEGKVAILVDGSPEVITVPTIFMEFLAASEDYYQNSLFSTFTRWLRIITFIGTLFLPPLYVAVISFHQEMLPTPLVISVAAAREGVPFPVVIEAILMGLLFELLREAGTRMPRPIGQSVSIVGAVIVGQAAVEAGLTSTPMVMVAALTGLGIFAVPSVDMALALIPLRLLLTIFASVLGLFGILAGQLIITIHMASLRSFGIPYLSPLAPGTYQGLKDTLVRAPWWAMNTRPQLMTENEVRQDINQQPQDPEDDESDLLNE